MCAALLAAGMLLGPLRADHALAGLSTCGTDPIVTLSDGTVLTLSAAIADDPSDVRGISYVVHAPQGVSLVSVVYNDALSNLETVRFVADDQPGEYTTVTTVYTGLPNIPVTATTAGTNPLTGNQNSASKSGLSGQKLRIVVF